jgi:DNA polymerase I-like protein with 3'-5' exonuclease and polymerase domains
MRCIVDIETDGFIENLNTIHCIVAKDVDTNEVFSFVQDECYTKFPEFSKKIDKFIMHNGISFDARILNSFNITTITPTKVIDTLLLSQLLYPEIEGGHSLSSWGERFKSSKGDCEDFKYYTPEMLEYCKQDVEITHKLYKYISSHLYGCPPQAIELEHKIRAIVDQQEINGFSLDERKASLLVAQFLDETIELETKLQEIFPPITHQRYSEKTGKKLQDKVEVFNVASRKQIAERLQTLGWIPKKVTPKGHVIVDEGVLKGIDLPEAQLISRCLLLQKRMVQINSWRSLVDKNGRVHGKVMTLRAVTGRMAHHSPNMAQVPASYSIYGKECRECWTVSDPDRYVLVGTDASQLEIRCLAHYMNDEKFTKEILEGDIHTYNQHKAGLKNRDEAKTFIYAMMFGAGAEKIGLIAGTSKQKGKLLIDSFLRNLPAFKNLKSNLEHTARGGRIKGLDGRPLVIRSSHKALNTLIQGAGAIICKTWLVCITKRISSYNIDARLVASIHDEYQFEVRKDHVEVFCTITKDAMKEAEKILKLKCPMDNDYKIGKTWAETH